MRERVRRSRLVTLVGAGGVGKTRIAMEVASRLLDGSSSDGALEGLAWVELSPVTDTDQMVEAIGAALGLQSQAEDLGRDTPAAPVAPAARLAARLAAHLAAPGPAMASHPGQLRASAQVSRPGGRNSPRVQPKSADSLATSRQRLGLSGEVVWSVPIPCRSAAGRAHGARDRCSRPRDGVYCREALRRTGWKRRAPATVWNSRQDVEAVCTICRRLDGIPLAIELAAARFGLLSLPQIAHRLNDRFGLLSRGSRDRSPAPPDAAGTDRLVLRSPYR